MSSRYLPLAKNAPANGPVTVAAVSRSHPARPRHDGPDAVTAHQSFDAAAAHSAALGLQLGMDTRAAIASAGVAMNPFNVVDGVTIGADRRLSSRERQA
jgi:hypothetical protein